MTEGGLITCTDSLALEALLARLTSAGLKFHRTFPFSLIDDPRASVIITAEPDILKRICAIANFVNDYQI